MPIFSTQHVLSLCVLGCSVAMAQAEVAPSQLPEPKILAMADLHIDFILAESQEGDANISPRLKALGPASDVFDKFLRLSEADMLKSPMLTDGSRDLLPSSPGRLQLARLVELREAHWYDQVVDARFADETLATLIILYTPRQPATGKQIITLDLVRRHDVWQVTLDLDADARLPLGDRAAPTVAALRAAVDRRVAELLSVTSAPFDKPLPFHGTWSTHFGTSFVYLSFYSSGEVFMLQTHEGSHSLDVYDFHVTDDEVVIESRGAPIRLRRLSDVYEEHDGKRHESLKIEDPRIWFPECKEPLLLRPQTYKGDWPVRRPIETAPIESAPAAP